MFHRLVRIGLTELILAYTPDITEEIFQTKEYRDIGNISRCPVLIQDVMGCNTQPVGELHSGTQMEDRIIAVIITPCPEGGHTGAEAPLIKSVCILVGVEGCLDVAGAHDYLDKYLDHGCGSHCARKPSGTVLMGGCRKLGSSAVRSATTKQGAVGTIP